MALLPCPDCGNPTSDQAAACPRCGRPVAKPPVISSAHTKPSAADEARKRKETLLGGGLVIGILLVIGAASGSFSDKSGSGRITSANVAVPATVTVQPRPTEDMNSAAAMVMRRKFGETFERQQLAKGLDWHVTVYGKHAEIMRMEWILMSRPAVYRETQDADAMTSLRLIGFRKLVFTNGSETWTWDL